MEGPRADRTGGYPLRSVCAQMSDLDDAAKIQGERS